MPGKNAFLQAFGQKIRSPKPIFSSNEKNKKRSFLIVFEH
jgi:hypothetical protein